MPFLNSDAAPKRGREAEGGADTFDQAIAARRTSPGRGARHRRAIGRANCARSNVASRAARGFRGGRGSSTRSTRPAIYTGYGVKTLPAVREAIEQHAWNEAEAQAVVTAEAIGRAADVLDRATAIVAGP